MIDLKSAYVRAVLQGVTARVAQAAEALDWADGLQVLNADDLTRPLRTPDDQKAFTQLARQIQGMGPRAIAHKRSSTIGSINWGGDDPNGIDARIDDLDLQRLASTALKSLVAVGAAGVLPYQPEGGQPRLQNMGGYLEPLYAEDDVNGHAIAWLQVLSEDGNKFRLRVYEPDLNDPTYGVITEWRKARNAYEIGNHPSDVWEAQVMPTFVLVDTAQDGTPLGELSQALPVLRGEVAQQLRILRASQANAWPIRWAVGDWDLQSEVSALDILVADSPGSQIGVLDAPALEGMVVLHDRILERLRGDLKLPISSITTGTFPSGEALDQANAISISTASQYAGLLARLLSGGVRGFALLLGIPEEKAPPVSVSINREQTRRLITEQVRLDYRDGLVSFRAAVLTVAQYYPHWSDEEVEEFITEQTARVSVDDFNAFVTGGQTAGGGDSVSIKDRADALGVLVRAGVQPDTAAQMVGLPMAEFTGAVPVSLRVPERQAQSLEE